MLSCYSRRLLSLAWRNSQLFPVSVTRNDFCSTVKQSDQKTDNVGSNSEVTSIEDLLKHGNLGYVQKACTALMQICQMKKENKISEADYRNDERFVKMLTTLESNHVQKAENMLIISSLKVENLIIQCERPIYTSSSFRL